jgi:hypothetical protein
MMPPPSMPSPSIDDGRPEVASPSGSDRGGDGCGDCADEMRGLVRDVRVEAEYLDRALGPVEAALLLPVKAGQAAQLADALEVLGRAASAHGAVVDQRLAALRRIFADCRYLYDGVGDEVAEMANLWQDAIAALPASGTTADAARTAVPAMRGALAEIAWHAALVTIPERVRQHLRTLRIGGQLKFDETFADELPDAVHRVRMLHYLKAHPAAISGIVDAEHGVIYAASPSQRRRMGSLAIFGLLLIAGIGIVWIATRGLGAFLTPTWVFATDRFADLAGAYGLLFAGAVIHMIVDAVKQQQRSGPGAFIALDDWFQWLHVREVSNAVSILSLWLVVFLLAVAYPGGIDRLAALFAGYSLDSVIGVAISRFDTLATSRSGEVEKVISG